MFSSFFIRCKNKWLFPENEIKHPSRALKKKWYLESNNEYWLEDDARLRSDFNITTGPKYDEISFFKSKRKMKEYYKKAGVVTARYYMVKTLLGCKRFVNKVGFPVVVKPDNGVGAAATYKISNYEELVNFYNTYNKDILYIMEEFIPGDLIYLERRI